MNVRMKKYILLRTGLFLLELGIFTGVSWLLQIGLRETAMFSAIYFLVILFYSHYKFQPELIWQEIVQMMHAHVLYWILAGIMSVYLKNNILFKITIVTGIMYCVCILLGRQYRRWFQKSFATRLLILGAGKGAEDMDYVFKLNRFMFVNPLAYVDLEFMTGEKPSQEKRIRDLIIPWESMGAFLDENEVDEVFVVDDALTSEQLEEVTSYFRNKVPVIKYKPKAKMVQPYNTDVSDFDGNLFVSVTDAKKRYFDIVFKKIIDILAGIAGCLLLIPLTIFVKCASLKRGDKDPIFFRQDRVGKDGKIIKIYKYRSMIPNAEQVLEEMMEKDPKIREEYLTNKKLDPDPRVTPLGEFLRKTSLDEMPQFINILKGEMSLIGPRPYLPREIGDMGESYDIVIKSKPGITGMWQANGRSDVGFAERCKLDVYYYDNWSIWLDIIIIVKTIKVVLRRDGAV